MNTSGWPALRLTSGQQELLRWLAILCMVIDHVGYIFFTPSDALPLRAVGRIAWPVFAFLLAYNVAVRDVNPVRYLRNLGIFTLLSQLPHTLAFGWHGVSIMGTLLLGALALVLVTGRIREPAPVVLLAGGIFFAAGFVEYGHAGVLLVVALWWSLRAGGAVWLVGIAAVGLVNWSWELWPYGLMAVPLTLLVSRLPFGLPRSGLLPWIFYPAHLLLLAGVDRLL